MSVAPSEDLGALVRGSPPETTFCLLPGVHFVGAPVEPKDRDRFLGVPGAVLSGARPLVSWEREGSSWFSSGQTQRGQVSGECSSGSSACRYPEDVYRDGSPLKRVMSRQKLGPGSFFFDYEAQRIYVGEDPSGRSIEAAATPAAFLGGGSGVVVKGLVVEGFASPAQHGAIDAGAPASGWDIESNEIRLNHGAGISAGSGAVVRGNYVHHQGQIGIVGVGNGILVENNEIAFNNTAGFSFGWEAGGGKWTRTDGLVVRGNKVHDNAGPGLWTDINSIHTLYEANIVERNADAGIFHEISFDAVIRNNTVLGNGFARGDWMWGAGIQIAASPNVEVEANVVEGNANGIALIQQDRRDSPSPGYGPHELRDVKVQGNQVSMGQGLTGLVQDVGDDSYFTSRGISFSMNTYRFSGQGRDHYAWRDSAIPFSRWIGYGHDAGGLAAS